MDIPQIALAAKLGALIRTSNAGWKKFSLFNKSTDRHALETLVDR